MDVKGKVAIVTGASGGIGLATAKLLQAKEPNLRWSPAQKINLKHSPKNCLKPSQFPLTFQR